MKFSDWIEMFCKCPSSPSRVASSTETDINILAPNRAVSGERSHKITNIKSAGCSLLIAF